MYPASSLFVDRIKLPRTTPDIQTVEISVKAICIIELCCLKERYFIYEIELKILIIKISEDTALLTTDY